MITSYVSNMTSQVGKLPVACQVRMCIRSRFRTLLSVFCALFARRPSACNCNTKGNIFNRVKHVDTATHWYSNEVEHRTELTWYVALTWRATTKSELKLKQARLCRFNGFKRVQETEKLATVKQHCVFLGYILRAASQLSQGAATYQRNSLQNKLPFFRICPDARR
jgi:hypothetical protein